MTASAIQSVPALFAMSQGSRCDGPEACAFCAAPCDHSHSSKPFKSDIKLTAHNILTPKQAESIWCCRGCFASFRERTTIFFPPIPPDTKPTHQDSSRVSDYSWFLTHESAMAYDCANPTYRKLIRERLLSPLVPKVLAWACVLTTNKKEHIFWRGKVNDLAAPPFSVLLDKEVILYKPADLQKRLELVGRIKAVVLHCQTQDEFYENFLARYNDGEELLKTWKEVKSEGLSRLADFLAWEPEDCDGKFPPDVRAKVGRPTKAEAAERAEHQE